MMYSGSTGGVTQVLGRHPTQARARARSNSRVNALLRVVGWVLVCGLLGGCRPAAGPLALATELGQAKVALWEKYRTRLEVPFRPEGGEVLILHLADPEAGAATRTVESLADYRRWALQAGGQAVDGAGFHAGASFGVWWQLDDLLQQARPAPVPTGYPTPEALAGWLTPSCDLGVMSESTAALQTAAGARGLNLAQYGTIAYAARLQVETLTGAGAYRLAWVGADEAGGGSVFAEVELLGWADFNGDGAGEWLARVRTAGEGSFFTAQIRVLRPVSPAAAATVEALQQAFAADTHGDSEAQEIFAQP